MASRPPLVLLHGFPMDARIWAGVGDVGASVTTPSLSDFTHQYGRRREAFTIDDLADAVHEVIGRFGRRCVVGGLSMGGYVALSLAERYPADLAGLVLLDTKATADDAAARANRDRMIDLSRREGAGAIAEEMEPKLLARSTGAEVRQQFRRMANQDASTLIGCLTAMRDRPDRSAVLGRITVPTLCVVGAHDQATPPAVVEEMRRQVPTARPLAVVGDAGHIPPLENPAVTAGVLREFIASL